MCNPRMQVVWIDAAIAVSTFLGAGALRAPSLIPCFEGRLQYVLLVCPLLAMLDIALPPKIDLAGTVRVFLSVGTLGAIAAWFGFYQVTPLRFGGRGAPVMEGFRLTKSQRQPIIVAPGQVVLLAKGSTVAIEPIIQSGVGAACQWRSTNRGSIDDPASCDIAYRPPARLTYDVLNVLALPECGLPKQIGRIKISIAP